MNGDRKKIAKLTAVWFFALFACTVLFYQIMLPLILPIYQANAAENNKPKSYKIFSHGVLAHKRQSCAQCHQSPNGFSTAKTLDDASYRFPDIADYPPHSSCVNCHRQQFFNGARPQICTVCHTQSSPRVANRLAFPQLGQTSEFSITFPHDVHQDIIAQNKTAPRRSGEIAVAHFAAVKFSPVAPDDKIKADYNNCTICHTPAAGKTFVTAPRQPVETVLENSLVAVRARENIAVSIGHFKTAPTGHESCFSCHYSEQSPTRVDCAGCHVPTQVAPQNLIERTSLKFNHDQKTEAGTFPHERECTTCHVRITQSADLSSLNPDVPIFTCASKGTGCHSDEIRSEIDRRIGEILKKQANAGSPVQACSYCHNTFIGSFQVPESHQPIKP